VIAAGDTFRAAAVEQLQVWGDRAGVPVLTAPEGSDPASLAFDAMAKAEEDGADLLMIDTAGRLQNRADLMEELAKIVRVIRKREAECWSLWLISSAYPFMRLVLEKPSTIWLPLIQMSLLARLLGFETDGALDRSLARRERWRAQQVENGGFSDGFGCAGLFGCPDIYPER